MKLALAIIMASTAAASAAPLFHEPPGEPGIVVRYAPSKRACGGFEMHPMRTKRSLVDTDTATLFLMPLPPKLGLDNRPPISAAELQRFVAWLDNLRKMVDSIRQRADAAPGDIAIAAHTIVAERYAAELMIRAAVPKALLGGEFEDDVVEAYCDEIGQLADPILDDVQRRTEACRKLRVTAAFGFWDDVCA